MHFDKKSLLIILFFWTWKFDDKKIFFSVQNVLQNTIDFIFVDDDFFVGFGRDVVLIVSVFFTLCLCKIFILLIGIVRVFFTLWIISTGKLLHIKLKNMKKRNSHPCKVKHTSVLSEKKFSTNRIYSFHANKNASIHTNIFILEISTCRWCSHTYAVQFTYACYYHMEYANVCANAHVFETANQMMM